MSTQPERPGKGACFQPRDEGDFIQLFNLSLDLLCIAGIDGYFKRVNPSWTRVLGWTEAELLARPVEDFMHPDDRERTLQARADLAKGKLVRGLENRYLCKDGSHRWLSWQSSISADALVVFAVARDITERRQLDYERLVLSKLESTGILAGGIAHDFNNLLASLMLNLEMVSLCAPTTAEQKLHLRQAEQSVIAGKALTQQFIAFAGGGVPSRQINDLSSLLRESLDVALHDSAIKGECVIAANLWAVDVDEDQFREVLRGLILNAREASAPGGIVHLDARNVRLEQHFGSDLPAGDYLRIQISDQGAGMTADILPKIFDPYFSTKQRGTQKGMGLGLTLSRTIIQKHRGSIAIESAPNRGTIVTCHLPVALTTASSSVATPRLRTAANARILVMDDEEMLRDTMALTLRQFGYDVEVAADGGEAVTRYERAAAEGHPFGVVILDLSVRGGMGGSEAMKQLQGRDPSVCAALMTGYTKDDAFRQHLRHGFKGALAKPFSAESLHALVTDLLRPPSRKTSAS